MTDLPRYDDFLNQFLDRGYRFELMGPGEPEPEGVLYLRHDIDFDVACARRAAEIEKEMGIVSTFYFMLTSGTYNLLTQSAQSDVRAIARMGHKVSLHFDPLVYDDVVAGLSAEASAFEALFDDRPDIVSIHRPTPEFVDSDESIAGISHTYQDRYTKSLHYSSDSQGRFRFGITTETEAFASGKSIHLLIHPIWWMREGKDPQEKLQNWAGEQFDAYTDVMAANCKTFTAKTAKLAIGLKP